MEKRSLNKLIASILCANMFVMNMPVTVMASEISGITPTTNNGVNTYNIEAAQRSGSTGFRHYDKFNLTQGDIANLKYGDYTKFVNLVNNQVNINGIVNTMKGNNFYNGHAIFISPNGIVIGSSGVLNVGSLSLLTPSQSKFDDFKSAYNSGSSDSLSPYEFGADKYKALITDSHGNVVINGKIFAREEVNVYGDTITIKGTDTDKAGIIAGWNDTSTTFSDVNAAKQVFNSLVSNNITDTTNYALDEKGKIKIVAGFKDYTGSGDDRKPDGASDKAEVIIENAQIGGSDVEIKANTTKDGLYILADTDEAISSKIDIAKSDITGSNIDISAVSESDLSRNLNLTVPAVLMWVFDSDSHVDEFFSDNVYTGFEGVRTAATVNITNSILNSTGDLSISAESSSDTNIGPQALGPTEVSQFVPAIFYGYGTQTESKINIKDSTLNANGDVDLRAFSNNVLYAKIADEVMAGVTLKATDAFNLAFMKNSAIADTKITIDNSNISGKNVTAEAIAYNEMDNRNILKPRIGNNDWVDMSQEGGQGGSAFSLAGILNATDIKSSIEVKNESNISATEDVTLNAYNINDVSNWVDSEITDPLGYDTEYTDPDKWYKQPFDKLGRTTKLYDQMHTFTLKDFATKFTNKAKNIGTQIHPESKNVLETANFQSGAAVVWNDANTTNNVIINNSTVSGKNIDIKAHTVDLTANEADAYAEESAKWGGAFSLVVNKQTNNNNVDIINAKLISEEDTKIDSIVELPAQQGTFGISNKYLTLGMNFGFSANDDWNFGFHDVTSDNSSEKILPEAGIFGFYNNFGAASSAGDKASISAAVIYSQLENNSDINITNSSITSDTGSIIMNSAASVSAHDAVDFVNFNGVIDTIKSLVKKESNKWNHESGSGAGGSVLVQNFTNNARITVDNSKLTAQSGDIELNTAAEQSYLNLITPGGKAETFGLTGAVTVQNVHGTTSSTVKNNSELNANTISIDSGKANVQFTKKGSDMKSTGLEFLNDDDEVELADARDVKDHVTAVAINGSLTKQSGEGQGTTSSGAAVGASVVVQAIDRNVKTSIQNSTLTADKIAAKSESYTRDIFVTAAGAFAGGVSPDTEVQAENNANPPAGNEGQEMQNFGNWMDILDDANADEEDVLGLNQLFNENNPNIEGAQNAAGQAGGANQLAGGGANPQGASGNFSLALAGSVSVVNDKSVITTEIINSTLNVGEELSATADRENFMLNVTGGIAKSGSVGGGAAVNVYSDKGGAISKIDGSTISFTSNNAKLLNVTADNDHTIIEAAVGVGIASNDKSGAKVAVGGSFSTNVLKDETKSIINNTTVKNAENATGDIDVKLDSNADTTAWNVGGDLGFAKGSNATFGLGAGVAGNLNLLKQTVISEITNSQSLVDLKNVTVNSDLAQEINSIAVAGAAVTGAQSSFTIDGALGIDLIENTVTAQLKDNAKISSSGNIKVDAKSEITGRDLTGSVDVSTAENSVGVGIGSIIEVDNSKINAKIDNSKIEKSNSIEVKADSSDDRKFLAANLGVQTGGGTTVAITANGIVSVLESTINAAVINGSELSSDGAITINSIYDNKNQGITALGAVAKNGGAIGANIIANHYGNDITSELSKDSKILKSSSIGIGANSSEYISMIPAAVAASTGGLGSVAANVAVNVIKDSTIAKAEGNLETTGNLTVAADSETTIYNRGGTLAIASADALVALGGSINVDYIGKTVNAYIGNETAKNIVKAGGTTSVSALSTNSIGGTKNSSGKYDRDDITSDSYQDKLMKKDSDGNYSGINYDNDFGNWNMFYNLSAGATAAISGAVLVKTIDNTVSAKIINSDLTSNNMNILAEDYSVKNIIAGQIGASSTAAVGATVLVTNDDSNTSALISNGSDIKVANTINISALNKKDNNQIVVSGGGANNVAGSVNVIVNNIDDNNHAKIDSSKVKAGTLNMTANEDMNASHIVVSGSGAGEGVAINVNPLINKYEGETIAQITKSTVNDAAITMQSDTDIKTRDIMVGVAVAGEGAALQGLAIKNTYDTTTKSIIDENSTIDTLKDVTLNANSALNSNNWIAGLSFAGEGASVITNVIINNMISDVETNISDSNIISAGKITLNSNKDKKDVLKNYGIATSGAGIGAAAIANVIYNIYENDVTSKIYNTSVGSSNSITAQAFSDRRITNYNVGIGATGIGANLLANALVNEIGTDTVATVDAQSKTIKSSGKLTVKAEDNTFADNTMGFGAAVGIGAALGANINLYYSDNLASADVKTNGGGQIDVGSADISAKQVGGLDNTNVGVAAGLVGIAGDVVSIKLGKHLDYTDSEKKSGIKDADTRVKGIYDQNTDTSERNFRTDSSSKVETGAVARVKGNLKSKNDINVKAESKLKGKGADDKLNLSNVQVTAGLGTGSVAVRNVQLSNNAIAEIAGGNVESTSGKISVNAVNNSNVEINTVKVDVSGLTFSGGGSTYNNTSETIAQIGSSNNNTTVKAASGIDVVSTSTNKSVIDATNVVVTGGGIVAVDLSENKDSNNTSAQIIGKTNIDTEGKLNIHSKTNTDLSSTKSTVTVSGSSMVSVSKNEVEASVISKAVMENVEGTIKANGIDIVTDYDTMSAFSKANVTAVKLSDLYSGDSSGAKMNAKFTSGIYGEKDGSKIASDVVINNSGKTTIETAKKTGSKGIEAKSEINNVHVSLVGFVAETTAKAENTAESNTILMAKDHRASSLDINSYLDSVADATAGAVKATVGIGVNLASTDAKDTSNLNVDIAGSNTIIGKAVINATHNAEVKSDMSSFNFGGLVGGGQKVRINAEATANTTGNIGGEFNANNADIAFTTNRNSVMTKSSGSGGGIVNVSDTKASNKLNGTSTLNIKNYKSDKDIANNNLTISNVSNNTFDTTSHDGSGGFINISQNDTTTELKATTVTNIINSIINSNSKVSYDVQNNTTVKDTASMGGGGFVAVMDNTSTNTYTSGAKLSVQDTTINANDIELKTLSSIKSANNDWVDYVGRGGGFIAENEMKLTNNLNQTSEIEVKNSKLHANNEAKIEAKTSSAFRQRTDSAVSGFTAMPRSKNWLNVTNNNKITVDNKSIVTGNDKLTINFDSDNELKARAVAESNHFGFRDPVAESYIDLRINNTLQNDGSLQGGNLVDVNFMNNSTNNLTQYTYSEANAAIATTTEDGKITKKITNALNISSNADITSNKDVEISYSSGSGNSDSTIKWKTTSYGLFGIPITNSKTYSKTDISTNNTLTVNGKIVAGQGNSKYMKINKDGDVDTNTLSGFSAGDYTLTGGEALDGQQIKDKKLANIQIKIDNADAELEKINAEIVDLNEAKAAYETEKTNTQDIVTELNTLAEGGYTFKNNVTDSDGNSDFNTIVQNDLKSQIVGEGDSKLTEAEYTALLNAYQTKVNEIESYNNNKDNIGNADYPKTSPTISDFLTSYSIVEDTTKNSAKISTVKTAYNTVNGKFGTAEKSGYTTYTSLDGNKYISVSNPTTVDGKQTCDEITQLNNQITALEEQLKPYTDKLTAANQMKTDLTADITAWTNEKTTISNTPASEFGVSSEKYAVVFNDMQAKDAHILIEGINNDTSQFKGSGTLDVASQGVKIDNYSTRSLIFNDIDMAGSSQSGLIIGGKNFSEFAGDGTNQAVNGAGAYIYKFTGLGKFDTVGKEGAHYISSSVSSNGISGIIVNNFYDIFNPFAKTQDILNPTLASDITFNGAVKTGSNFNVFNDSGSIIANAINTNNISGAINLVSTKGDVNLTSNNTIGLKANDSIFAGNSVNIKANTTDIKGNVTAGYNADLKLTITDDMLSNLSFDPVTGENILINLGNTPYTNTDNNVKALYKDGQIYLFNINDEVNGVNQADRGKVNITSNNNSVTGTIKTYDGYQKIEIENKTNKPLIVSDITNQKSAGGVYTNGTKSASAETQNNAETYVTSTGKLVLDGVIKNNIISGSANSETFGQLQITANNGLDINKQTNSENDVINSIYDGGVTRIIVNSGNANIAGNIDNYGRNISIENNGTGKLDITGNITNSTNNATDYIAINSKGQTEISSAITSKINGNITIASEGLNLTETSVLDNKKGNISITNNAAQNTNSTMTLAGNVKAQEGSIEITNNGKTANLGGTISDEKGDITILNNKGDMTISAAIAHDLVNTTSNGMISITNAENAGKLDIKSAIQTYGAGKTVTDGTNETLMAILIDNKSTAGGLEMNNGTISARLGDIVINNTAKDLNLVSGTITNSEQGSVIITNSGDKLSSTAAINVKLGNVNVTNTGSGQSVIGGSITNQEGNTSINNTNADGGSIQITGTIDNKNGSTSIANSGTGLEITSDSIITNNNGSISVTNSKGQLTANGRIENKKGDITVTNSGTNADIAGIVLADNGNIGITNNAGAMNIKGKVTNIKGDTTITNNDGNLTVAENAEVKNTENGNITAENKGGKFSIAGLLQHLGVGNITAKNSGDNGLETADTSKIAVNNGNINIENTKGTLSANGKIENTKGNVTISNSGSTADIAGTVLAKEGNIEISNSNDGALNIKGNIKDENGKIDITNSSNDGMNFVANSVVENVKGNTTITNNNGDLTIENNAVIKNTESGNITAENKGGKFTIAGLLQHLGIGNITAKNSGTGGTEISGTVSAKEGTITVSNTEGALNLTDNSKVADDKGAISITNTAADKGTTLAGEISAKDGNITVANAGDKLAVSGNITDNKGNISITNSGNNGTEFTSAAKVTNVKGDTTITNNNGDLTVENGAAIKNTESGNIIAENKGGKFSIAGLLQHLGVGNITAKNSGDNGLETADTSKIAVNNGNINIENTKGTLSANGKIENTKGNVTISNSGSTADIAGTVLAKEGNIEISNSNDGALNIKGNIKDENGKIDITNSSNDGMNFVANSVVENVKGNTTITNNNGDLTIAENAEVKNTKSGNITAENKGGKFTIAGLMQHLGIGNITAKNSGNDALNIATTGNVIAANGNIDIQNSNAGGLNVEGNVADTKGKTTITNTSADGIKVATTGKINNNDGNIEISNTGSNGISIEGSVKADKQNIVITNKDSNITIGEYASDNDNYINAVTGNVVVNQTNGDILNGITDTDTSAKHQNHDLGNANHSYKTLIASGNDLIINAIDGNIGSTTNANPGVSIDASTRDYTESLNINVGGTVSTRATNENNSDKRLVNIRAKDSDLNLKDVTSEGNVILTAADWKQADTRPTPDDEEYFKGYSVLSANTGNDVSVTGQNISIIASDQLGNEEHKLVYMQDTLNAPDSMVSFETENDLYMTGKANSANETKIYQIISKHGSIDLDFESDAAIKEITANKGLTVTQKAQNLTIYDLGMPVSAQGASTPFEDMLNSHDDLVYGIDPVTPSNSVIPNYINIRALDAMENAGRSESNLRIYNATVAGNHGENTQYYENGTRLADVTLMADNIYANSYKAPDSTVSTKANPNGYKQTGRTYTDEAFGGDGSVVYEAHGINAYGDGEPIALDILGVDADIVNALVSNPNRDKYTTQKSVSTTPAKFYNANDEIAYYGTDFKAKNVAISVNDYADTNRGVVFDTLYANNAYVNTKDTNLNVENGYITNYAEIRNNDKIAVVDNDFRRIVSPANIQLYTQKTGSFALGLDRTINMTTTAPTVYNNPHMLVNGYHSEWNFVNKGQKESKDLYENKKMSEYLDKYKYNEPQKRISERFDTTNDTGLSSDFEILDISTTGASVKNDKKLKRGKKTTITIKFDDVDITVNAKVVKVEGNKAGLQFIDMPKDVANKILYRYMQRADSMKSNLMTSSL